MSKHRCPCCGWTILRAVERPDVLVACSNCSQVVRVSSVPSAAIPKCNTESMIDWGTEGAPQAPDGVPLLPVELCIPLRKSRPATAFARSGLLGMGMSIVLAFTVWRLGCESGLLQSLPARLLLLGAFGMFFLSSVRVLYLGFRRFRRYSPAQLLSVAQLPPEVERLGVPLALHRNPSGVPPAVRFLIGLSILVGAVVCAILLLLDEIWSMRLMALACLGVLSGVAAIRSAVSYRRLRVLVYRDGFVVLRGREIGVLWRWQDIESVHLQKSSHIPVMFAYTLRRV